MSAQTDWLVHALQNSVLFKTADRSRLESLVDGCRVRTVRAGDTVAWENDPQGQVFFVIEGRVAVEKAAEGGVSVHVATLAEGEIAGELSLFLDQPRRANLRALDECKLIVLDGRALQSALLSDAKLGYCVIQALARRVANATEDKGRAQWKLTKRIAYVLVEEARRNGQKTDRGFVVELPLSQQELATQLGVTREALNRSIRELREQGILEWSPRSVRILKAGELKALLR